MFARVLRLFVHEVLIERLSWSCEHALAFATSQYCFRNDILRRFSTTLARFLSNIKHGKRRTYQEQRKINFDGIGAGSNQSYPIISRNT
jgi:hypothetical protein